MKHNTGGIGQKGRKSGGPGSSLSDEDFILFWERERSRPLDLFPVRSGMYNTQRTLDRLIAGSEYFKFD